jgi:hypothetical protein
VGQLYGEVSSQLHGFLTYLTQQLGYYPSRVCLTYSIASYTATAALFAWLLVALHWLCGQAARPPRRSERCVQAGLCRQQLLAAMAGRWLRLGALIGLSLKLKFWCLRYS